MAVNQTITNFINKAAVDDFARNNLFRVVSFDCRGIQLSENDLLYCKGGNLPGRENGQGTVKYMGMSMPYAASTVNYPGNNDYSLEFYVDADSKLLQALEVASRTEFNDVTSTGNWKFPDTSNIVTLAALDMKMEPIEYIRLYGVCFKSFDTVKFDTADGDGTAITVTLHISYLYYKRTGSDTVWADV